MEVCFRGGGQKQKIALARALVHNKPIIIFDEATSNTDIYTEMQINRLLKTRLIDNTVIIVTHRQEILKDVDNIIVIEEGCISTSGTYSQLYEENDNFREMIKMASQKN